MSSLWSRGSDMQRILLMSEWFISTFSIYSSYVHIRSLIVVITNDIKFLSFSWVIIKIPGDEHFSNMFIVNKEKNARLHTM